MSKIVIVKTCKDCGALFNITEGEANFLETHNLAMFERCYDCRKLRKAQREAFTQIQASISKPEEKQTASEEKSEQE